MCGFCNVWVCVCVLSVMCGFCNVWVCVCVGVRARVSGLLRSTVYSKFVKSCDYIHLISASAFHSHTVIISNILALILTHYMILHDLFILK
jgi:hypothetical protein